jgi:putative membrane protein
MTKSCSIKSDPVSKSVLRERHVARKISRMLIRWLVASVHLVALGLGLGSIWARGRALRSIAGPGALKRVFFADSLWGIAALLWIATGLARAFGGLEKGTSYYLTQPMFHIKMGLLIVILMLEVWPMVTLIRWRVQNAKGQTPDVARAGAFATISYVQAVLVILMVFAATAMARGLRP